MPAPVEPASEEESNTRSGLVEDILPTPGQSPIDVLALDEALERLTRFDPRQGLIVEMPLFGCLSFEEFTSVLRIGERTVKRDWSMARAWLKGELSKQP